MLEATLTFDRSDVIGATDRRLFGAFVEHLGRCVYGGIYEPGHPTATDDGFRGDVLELVRELGATIIRYPGGNFVSGYDWEDGVGPVEDRPKRLELAWLSIEPNTFGTNEFIDWCRKGDLEPMLAVNLGTRGPDDARKLLEYCNFPAGTKYSDLRREHGWEKPHDIKFWCLGNEMDGPWQMGTKTATEYGRIAVEAAKMMRTIDPSIELAAVGSSGRNMPTFGAWEREVLRHTFHQIDFISLHTYLNDQARDTPAFLASSDAMDDFIEEVIGIADEVATELGSDKRIDLSFDEWNVWYRTRSGSDRTLPGWPVAPSILEERYTMKDALAFAGACISLLNHADRVKSACLAQLVNAIAPILTETGGPAWRQTIFWPFADFANLGRGDVLRSSVNSPTYATVYHAPRGENDFAHEMPAVPFLKAAVVYSAEEKIVTLFLLNRSLDEAMSVAIDGTGFSSLTPDTATVLRHDDLEAINTRDQQPVFPAPLPAFGADDKGRITLPPASWTVVRMKCEL
ncbi:alpha-N-arabinofuranosidase [Arsenicitalea aurantiaca]|uniref:non-reducing end alpha-L-arabinofuranosidase n=1 Tax=Arsenicitalea aurantiaca TaxID=1783274 RepID=A0A433X2H2_9HYPH|nr:alpha-N-arabinofuranosidase [Arsenicitalea aurantiaca]RUT28285.1 alpha-N-arabinofuranosidase [Arsenicitalea aurantiaca]